jgi:uncharacterized protein (DUF305 family)
MRCVVWMLAAGIAASGAGPAAAQGHDHAHAPPRTGAPAVPETPATRAFKAAHERMMQAMGLPYTGDPDVDFRVQMIPHHQGAIDMARVAMAHAKNPWTRQLAESVIVEQQREIAEMQAWLAQHGAAVPPGGQPRHIMGADAYRTLPEEAGTRGEARGQSWAPSSGIRAR